MARPLLTLILLSVVASPAFSQKLLLTGGYTRVGENSFTGAVSGGLNAVFPLSRHLATGVGLTAARNRQDYRELLPGNSFEGLPDRTITAYHNSLYSLHGFVAGKLQLAPRLELLAGPSAGLYVVGARERSNDLKPGFGLWSEVAYHNLGGSRFSLEAVFHPRALLKSFFVATDSDYRFENQRLFVWDAQVGLSYDLRRRP